MDGPRHPLKQLPIGGPMEGPEPPVTASTVLGEVCRSRLGAWMHNDAHGGCFPRDFSLSSFDALGSETNLALEEMPIPTATSPVTPRHRGCMKIVGNHWLD